MVDVRAFGIIGGDKRQIAVAESISSDGYNVYVAGFDKIDIKNSILKGSIEEVINNSECIILPLPATKKGSILNAPFSEEEILITNDIIEMMKDKKVFCGMASKLIDTNDRWKSLNIYDYSKREEFSVKNAVPTAEGAIEIAMREYPGTINGSNCLVAGYGRIGKVLAYMLKGLGANVTVSARKPKDIAGIQVMGYKPIQTSDIRYTKGYDIIFNTVPYVIFNANTLAHSAINSIVIDLASAPGGVDFVAAKRMGIKTIQALSLPGKIAPKAAGEIIKDTIYNMLEEDSR